MSVIRVAVFPADALNATEIHNALSKCVNLEVWGLSSTERHARYVFKNYYSRLPHLSSEDFFDHLESFVKDHEIDVIIPSHDTVALELAKKKDQISAIVLAADERTSEICRSKKACFELFEGCSFNPKIYKKPEDVCFFPVFAKPDKGQGAVGAHIVQDNGDLESVDFSRDVVCEYLPGEELTIDCLTDADGVLRVVSPRLRSRIQSGVCVKSSSIDLTSEVEAIAQEINSRLSFLGLWFFQLKKDSKGDCKLLEISTRCAGTMCLSRAKGYNLPLMSVYAALGFDLSIINNGYNVTVDRELTSCYEIDYEYDSVYLDYDDTLVMASGEVNLDAVRFVYQCRNKGIPVMLISRHEGDLGMDLAAVAIDRNLFDEIILVEPGQAKSDMMRADRKAIFIDNAFKERREVRDALGFPVFDVSEIEVLLDYRS